MFPINIAWDFAPGRQEVLQACVEQGVGLVAMKPFGGGRLFQQKDRPVGPVSVPALGPSGTASDVGI
jgi:aryl-alcohol dehydrogenase-like predicted oxidoreductase